MRHLFRITIPLIALLMSSCILSLGPSIKGEGEVITRTRNVKDFSSISVSNGLDLYIQQGAKTSVMVETHENLHDIIRTEVVNGELNIFTDERIITKAKKIYVTVNNLSALSCEAGSDTYIKEVFKTESIDISVSSGADARLNLDATKVMLDVSSGASAKLFGKTHEFICESSSGSNIYAYDFISDICTAHASSGGDAKVFAKESIKARASSGGDVSYMGDPQNVDAGESSGGDVSKR